MRFIWSAAAFVLAAVLIGTGVAQRTLFQGPESQSVDIALSGDAPYAVVDGEVLRSHPGTQTVRASDPDGVVIAYGRTDDVTAWLAGLDYVRVSAGPDGTAAVDDVAADTASSSPAVARTPAGSDLWLGEYTDPAAVSATMQIPEGMSLLIASDGTAPAPSTITVTWPVVNRTPWAGPLIVAGSILLVIGIVLYILAIRHSRRSRGPRRKAPPPLPDTQPIDVAEDPDSALAAPPTRRSLGARRRLAVLVAALAVPITVSGCTAEAWPEPAAAPAASPTPTIVDAEDQQAPVVSVAQAERILQRVAETVAAADAARDPALAETRLDGAALAQRRTNYSLRGSIPDYAPSAPIPSGSLEITLPQAFEGWPRTFMAVADEETASTVMMLTQADPWSPYKLQYAADLVAATELPELAPAYIGAPQVPPDFPFLVVAPDALASAYADVLARGAASEYADMFDERSDAFQAGVAADRQRRLDEFNATAAQTGTLEFGSVAGPDTPLGLATLESGAIVAVTVHETDTVRPANPDVVIKFDTNPTVQALTGASESQSGVTTTFVDQLFFYVPAEGSRDKIRLLGYSTSILDAKVI